MCKRTRRKTSSVWEATQATSYLGCSVSYVGYESDDTQYRGIPGRGKTSVGRVDVEGATRKERWNDETMCAERLADGVGEPADLVDAEDNVIVMGGVTAFLLP